MNTAILEIRSSSDVDPAVLELRRALVKAWRDDPKQSAAAHAAYALIRGKSIEKTFTPITRPGKLMHQSPNETRDACIKAALRGGPHTWSWASEVFEKMGIEKGKYGDYNLSSSQVMSQWIEEAKKQEAAWSI